MSTWDTDFESGLRDDFDATIVAAEFGYDARYNNGESMLLKWEIEGVDDEGVAFEDTLLITVGKGWESEDGGKTIIHSSGNANKRFNQNSTIAKIITRCVNDFGMGETLAGRGSQFESAVWQGLTFHFKREPIQSFGDGATDKDAPPKTRLMPTEFKGVASGGATGSSVTQGAVAATATASTQPADTMTSAPSGDVKRIAIEAKVKALASSAGSHVEFVNQAMSVDGVTEYDDLIEEIVDEAKLYSTVKGG